MDELLFLSIDEAMAEYKKQVKAYEEEFGKGSFDNIVLVDPLRLNVKTITRAIVLIKHAIDTKNDLSEYEMDSDIVF